MNLILNKINIIILFCLISLNAFSTFSPGNLKCEYKSNPIGIDTQKPRFSWIINSAKGINQSGYQLQVAQSSKDLKSGKSFLWNSDKIVSDNNFSIIYSGSKLDSSKKYYWRVRIWDQSGKKSKWSVIAEFTTGIMTENEWKNSKWIGYEILPDSMKVIPAVHLGGENLGNKLLKRAVIPYFRKNIVIDKPIAEAYVHVSGLGQYEFYLNGKKVGDDFLTPGWTNYTKRCLYNSYDVTDKLNIGENVLASIVGTGFYYINRERYRKITGGFGYPTFRLILTVRFKDGTQKEFVTDESWKTTQSPIEFTSIYGGEDYNANKEIAGWNQKTFNDSSWKNVVIDKGPGGEMKAQKEYPVKVMNTFEAKSIKSPLPGKYVYDFGQNASGIVEIEIHNGQKGDTIRITPSELIHENGTIISSVKGDFHFQYIIKGDKVETWRPRFTYFGFRYAMVEGATPASLAKETDKNRLNMKMLHVRNSMPSAGSFNCSNQLFNKIYNIINWSIRSNVVSVSTDCPHREKLGWLEQAHLMGESVKYNYDLFHLYNKIVDDMMEAQRPEGMIPSIAPEYVQFGGPFTDDPGYGSAMFYLPWFLYTWYGDKEVLERSYESLNHYITYLSSKAESNILTYGLGDWLDMGPKGPGSSQLTPISLTATSFYYMDALTLSKIAGVLGKNEDKNKYSQLAKDIMDAFNKKFYHQESKVYGTGSQTSYAVPLYLRFMNDKDKDYSQVLDNFKKSIYSKNLSVTSGDIGHHFFVQALRESGNSQLLYDITNRKDSMGYKYMIQKGMTSLAENWTALEGLSQNHMIMGHLMEWFYNGLAGIRQQEGDTGYKKLIIEPQFVNGIDWIRTSYKTMDGDVTVNWKTSGENYSVEIIIPNNSEALVILPVKKSNKELKVNGKNLKEVKSISNIIENKGKIQLTLGSGKYIFE